MADFYRDFVFTRNTAAVGTGDTSIQVEDVSLFPSNAMLAKGDYFLAFESPLNYPPSFEIVKLTNVNTSTKTLTVVRAQGGTSPQSHAIVTYIKGTLTSDMLRRARWAFSGTTAPAPDADIFGVGDRYYHTTENRYYAFTGVAGYLGDTFTRAASTTTMGSTEVQTIAGPVLNLPPGLTPSYTVPYVAPWFTLTTGVFGINGTNQAYLASGGAANSTSVVNVGGINIDFSFDVFASTTAGSDYGLIFRYDSAAQFGYYLQFNGTTATLYRVNTGTFTSLALTTTYTTNTTHTWRVVANGNSITVYKDGVSSISFTETVTAFLAGASPQVVGGHVGFRYGNSTAVGDTAIVWDNFLCTVPGNTTVNTPTPQGWAPTSDLPGYTPTNYLAKQLQSVEANLSSVAAQLDDAVQADQGTESTIAKHDVDVPVIVQSMDDLLTVVQTLDNRSSDDGAVLPVLANQLDDMLAALVLYNNPPNVRTTSTDITLADGDIVFANATGQSGRTLGAPPTYDAESQSSTSASSTLTTTATDLVIGWCGQWNNTGQTLNLDGVGMTSRAHASNSSDLIMFTADSVAAGSHTIQEVGIAGSASIYLSGAIGLTGGSSTGAVYGTFATGSSGPSGSVTMTIPSNSTIVVMGQQNSSSPGLNISNNNTTFTWTSRASYFSGSSNSFNCYTAYNASFSGSTTFTVSTTSGNAYLSVCIGVFPGPPQPGSLVYTLVTLPVVSKGARITVVNTDPVVTNAVRFTGGVINQQAQYYLQGNGDMASLISDGTSWYDLSTKSTVAPITSDYQMFACDGLVVASGTMNVTLPTVASANVGQRYTIKNVGTGTVTVLPGAGTIDGAGSFVISTQYTSVDFFFDGTSWWAA